MCDGGLTAMAISSAVMATAQGAAEIKAQKNQAKAQETAQKAASTREIQRQQMSMRAERMQQGDEETTIAQEQLKANREAEDAIATTVVAGEEAGVSGVAAGLNVQDYERKNAEYQGALAMQTRMHDSARRLSLANSGQQYVGNMANINQDIAQPDYLGVGLKTAGSLIATAQTYSLGKQARENNKLTREAMKGAQTNAQKGLTIGSQNIYNAGAGVRIAKSSTAQTAFNNSRFNINRLSFPPKYP